MDTFTYRYSLRMKWDGIVWSTQGVVSWMRSSRECSMTSLWPNWIFLLQRSPWLLQYVMVRWSLFVDGSSGWIFHWSLFADTDPVGNRRVVVVLWIRFLLPMCANNCECMCSDDCNHNIDRNLSGGSGPGLVHCVLWRATISGSGPLIARHALWDEPRAFRLYQLHSRYGVSWFYKEQ